MRVHLEALTRTQNTVATCIIAWSANILHSTHLLVRIVVCRFGWHDVGHRHYLPVLIGFAVAAHCCCAGGRSGKRGAAAGLQKSKLYEKRGNPNQSYQSICASPFRGHPHRPPFLLHSFLLSCMCTSTKLLSPPLPTILSSQDYIIITRL